MEKFVEVVKLFCVVLCVAVVGLFCEREEVTLLVHFKQLFDGVFVEVSFCLEVQ